MLYDITTPERGGMLFSNKSDILNSVCLSNDQKVELLQSIEKCEEIDLFAPIHFSKSGMILDFVTNLAEYIDNIADGMEAAAGK